MIIYLAIPALIIYCMIIAPAIMRYTQRRNKL